jgi:hypothetical protein
MSLVLPLLGALCAWLRTRTYLALENLAPQCASRAAGSVGTLTTSRLMGRGRLSALTSSSQR